MDVSIDFDTKKAALGGSESQFGAVIVQVGPLVAVKLSALARFYKPSVVLCFAIFASLWRSSDAFEQKRIIVQT